MIAWANRICDRIPLLGSIRQLLWVCREVRRVSAKVEACLDRIRPALIVLPEDNVEYTTGTFVKAGRERGIPTLIIPYTMANAIEPAESYLNVGPYDGARRMNRLISFFYPHWRYVHKGKMLVRLPNYWILAKEWLGVAPPRPWAINSSHADRVVVESEESFDYHRASGLDPRSLAVLGSPRMDELARFANRAAAEREALLAELGLPPRRLLVVCALPPNQNPDSRPGCEFDAYPALLRCWIDALARLPDVNLVLVPHPRNGAEEMAPFRRPEIRFVAGDIARYIAVCDLYVASVSATIGLAIACGKPVVNYDVYRYDYSDFRDVPGVLTMVDRASFERTLDRLVREPEFLAQIRELQRQAAPRWGLLDGRCGERLLREMNRHCGVPEKSLPLARSA
jgi:glycosyltransferase involved in cell wall biosynthesis